MTIREQVSKGSTTEIPMIISVDDHLVEPPHLWETWLPKKFKEKGPRVERRRLGDCLLYTSPSPRDS